MDDCYAEGMARYLRVHGVRLFDYPRFAEPLRDEVRANAERLAQAAGPFLKDQGRRKAVRETLLSLRETLRDGGSSRAAKEILEVLY